MSANPVLVDSSYYIRLMREGRDPLKSIALAAATRDIATCGVVRVEVGRAIMRKDHREKFHDAWDAMLNVPTDKRLWEQIETLAWQLDRSGIVLPLTDLVIACCAKRINAVLLTFDKHFKKIPGIVAINHLEATWQ